MWKKLGAALLAAFAVFTLMVVSVDVQPIGPEGSLVGLARLNGAFHSMTGFQGTLYSVTKYAGYVALLVAAGFAVFALMQLIRRKKLKRVDGDLIVLGILYAIVLCVYVLFEKFVINYRPVILDPAEGLEASYPSTHTMLAICILVPAIEQFRRRLSGWKAAAATGACAVLLAVIVVGRMLCGVHWLTDILGSVLLSLGLTCIYKGFAREYGRRRHRKHKQA